MRSGENNEGRKTNIAISLFKILPQMTFKGKKESTHILTCIILTKYVTRQSLLYTYVCMNETTGNTFSRYYYRISDQLIDYSSLRVHDNKPKLS